MIFRKEKGRYEGVTSDGKIVPFENGAEMVACAELRAELLRLVGRESEGVECRAQVKANNPSVSRADSSLCTKEPKKVRFTIDSETEYLDDATRG